MLVIVAKNEEWKKTKLCGCRYLLIFFWNTLDNCQEFFTSLFDVHQLNKEQQIDATIAATQQQ